MLRSFGKRPVGGTGTFCISPDSIAGCPKAGKTLSLLARREHWTRQETGDKIIRAAGIARAAFFVCAKSVHAGNLLGGENFCGKSESMFASLIV